MIQLPVSLGHVHLYSSFAVSSVATGLMFCFSSHYIGGLFWKPRDFERGGLFVAHQMPVKTERQQKTFPRFPKVWSRQSLWFLKYNRQIFAKQSIVYVILYLGWYGYFNE